jgi:hypothetical protein
LKEVLEPKKIVLALGYGALKGLIPFATQSDTENSPPLIPFTTCFALGILEKVGSELAANWICNSKNPRPAISLHNKELIQLISELGCKIIVWGTAVLLGFATLPLALTGGVLSGSITTARRLDSAIYYASREADAFGRFILVWNPIITITLFALETLAQATPSLVYPLNNNSRLFSVMAFCVSYMTLNINMSGRHPDEAPSKSLLFFATEIINNG